MMGEIISSSSKVYTNVSSEKSEIESISESRDDSTDSLVRTEEPAELWARGNAVRDSETSEPHTDCEGEDGGEGSVVGNGDRGGKFLSGSAKELWRPEEASELRTGCNGRGFSYAVIGIAMIGMSLSKIDPFFGLLNLPLVLLLSFCASITRGLPSTNSMTVGRIVVEMSM